MTVIFSLFLFLVFEDGALPSLGDPKLSEGVLWFCLAGLFAMVFGRTLVFRSIGLLGVTRGTTVKKMNPFFSILLAVIVLGESLVFEEVLGVMALAFAIFLLISDKSRKYEHEEENTPKDWLVVAPLYIPGILSCFAYAVSYIARKHGLITLGTPPLDPCERDGGVCFYLMLAIPFESYRRFVVEGSQHCPDNASHWGGDVSRAGAIFYGLTYEELSTVVMIGSLETFIAIFLSVAIFRLEIRPSLKQLSAALLASMGVSMVTIHAQ